VDSEQIARSLYESFLQVPEPRSNQGRRHPLAATLTLVVMASIAGVQSLTATAEWGRAQNPRLTEAMGFRRPHTLSSSTLRNIISRLDVQAFTNALKDWAWCYPLPSGTEIVWDSDARLGFRVAANRSSLSLLRPVGDATFEVVPLAFHAVKRVPTLRRWHRRI
jgi:hypothetical protein